MEEYVSYEVSKEVNDILGKSYARLFNTLTKNCWRSGGHASGPEIDDFYYYDDPFNIDDDTCLAFTWNELHALMNKVVVGDYRKTEFECIKDINEFAIELNKYIEEKNENES